MLENAFLPPAPKERRLFADFGGRFRRGGERGVLITHEEPTIHDSSWKGLQAKRRSKSLLNGMTEGCFREVALLTLQYSMSRLFVTYLGSI